MHSRWDALHKTSWSSLAQIHWSSVWTRASIEEVRLEENLTVCTKQLTRLLTYYHHQKPSNSAKCWILHIQDIVLIITRLIQQLLFTVLHGEKKRFHIHTSHILYDTVIWQDSGILLLLMCLSIWQQYSTYWNTITFKSLICTRRKLAAPTTLHKDIQLKT